MIVFDLKCRAEHVFEAWFASSAAYEDQKARGLLLCPVCGDTGIDKAVMAPNVAAKGNQHLAPIPHETPAVMAPPSPEAAAMVAVMQKLAEVQAEAIKTSTWVGKDFERQARAMDAGDVDQAQIHGQATPEQARAMMEDGIGVMPLLIPVIPPEERN
jgi:hypothetical protein